MSMTVQRRLGVLHTTNSFKLVTGHGVELPFADSISVEEDAVRPSRFYELLNRAWFPSGVPIYKCQYAFLSGSALDRIRVS